MAMDADSRQRFEQQRAHVERALARLDDVLLINDDECIRDALMQRFEFTFEMAWKAMHRFLLGQGERVAAKAWDVLPLDQQALLFSGSEARDLLRRYRNDLSHEDDQARAAEAAACVRTRGIAALHALRDDLRRR